MSNRAKPAYRAYAVEDREGEAESFWTQIGAAFTHADKQGFNIVLRALPVDGRIVLRRYTEKKASEETAAAGKSK